jgi:hypothetical protein
MGRVSARAYAAGAAFCVFSLGISRAVGAIASGSAMRGAGIRPTSGRCARLLNFRVADEQSHSRHIGECRVQDESTGAIVDEAVALTQPIVAGSDAACLPCYRGWTKSGRAFG